jgi:hypothetical protein
MKEPYNWLGSFSRVLVSQQLTMFTQVRRGRRFYGINILSRQKSASKKLLFSFSWIFLQEEELRCWLRSWRVQVDNEAPLR